ncbi:MAG: hypothetical protein ACKPKO_13530, partial [Candidatus Fonsibacter sp.]
GRPHFALASASEQHTNMPSPRIYSLISASKWWMILLPSETMSAVLHVSVASMVQVIPEREQCKRVAFAGFTGGDIVSLL